MNSVLVWVVVVVALGFDFTNGFHDTANAVATSVSTRALSPRTAVFVLLVIYWAFVRVTPGVANRGFRFGQLASGTWVAFTHGANDAQKTMGVIALALWKADKIDHFYIPAWVIVAAGLAIGAGTYVGGWRIMRTVGQRIFSIEPASGF